MAKKKNKKNVEVEQSVEVAIETPVEVPITEFQPEEVHAVAEVYTEQSVFQTEELDEAQALFKEEAAPVLDESEFEILNSEEIKLEEELIEASSDESSSESLEDSELGDYDTAEIEELEFVEDEQLESIVESVLFATDKPVTLNAFKVIFKGTNVKTDKIRRTIEKLSVAYASGNRGVYIEEVQGGYQLRTKLDNMNFLRRTLKVKPFKLSGPALEVLAIVAYKQPLIKHEIDEIRGVESGHLLRALMEKGIVAFSGKSDLPGKPMQYVTTKKFLEIFGLRNLKELPTLSQIDELLPEGINEDDEIKNSKLSSITDSMSQQVIEGGYSDGEEELVKITEQLGDIATSSDFFEKEKQRQKEKKDLEKAQNIREALEVGEQVSTRDLNWLKRYDEALAAGVKSVDDEEKVAGVVQAESVESDSMVITEEEVSIDFEEKEDELPEAASDEELEGSY
ncbi:MAG: SMC-Scp complex subunit ScpB [Bdellovibrionaceae bacterium]|nr:SMC-Scp complex subunit ScpB [Pseudobdellovibrionaceae bacterium]